MVGMKRSLFFPVLQSDKCLRFARECQDAPSYYVVYMESEFEQVAGIKQNGRGASFYCPFRHLLRLGGVITTYFHETTLTTVITRNSVQFDGLR